MEKATDDTTRSWSSISTLARALWAQAQLEDKNCLDPLHSSHHVHLGGDNKCVRILFLYIKGLGPFRTCGCATPSILCRPNELFSISLLVVHLLRASAMVIAFLDVDTVTAVLKDRLSVSAATLVNNKHYRAFLQ